MELSLNEMQQQIVDSIDRIVDRAGGTAHLVEVVDKSGCDIAMIDELAQAGFLNLALDLSPLEAAIAIERLAFHGAYVPMGATTLVFPMMTGRAAEGPVALAPGHDGAIFRYGLQAKHILIDDGDEALLLEPQEGDLVAINNDRAGTALARLVGNAKGRATSLGAGSGDKLRQWWRLAIAAEAAGTVRGALRLTARYLTDRIQFGRPLATFQTLQHRLSHIAVQSEGAYWLTMEAAARPDSAAHASVAATRSILAARLAFRETHQMHGAMGFTREYPLHVWSMKLPALQQEMGGSAGHARAVTEQRWAA
jgi:alkylation response protein AidB-like acyl-CoA dehydrogenase